MKVINLQNKYLLKATVYTIWSVSFLPQSAKILWLNGSLILRVGT